MNAFFFFIVWYSIIIEGRMVEVEVSYSVYFSDLLNKAVSLTITSNWTACIHV